MKLNANKLGLAAMIATAIYTIFSYLLATIFAMHYSMATPISSVSVSLITNYIFAFILASAYNRLLDI